MPDIELPDSNMVDSISKEKVDFIETQVNKMLDFVLESRAILAKEAHTTLQWLFGLIVGPAGYLITLYARQTEPQGRGFGSLWWIELPLAFVTAAASFAAHQLMKCAMTARPIDMRGNAAQNLTIEGLAHRKEHQIRFLEAWMLLGRINAVKDDNRVVGIAINNARRRVIAIPFGAMLFLLLWALLAWLAYGWIWDTFITAIYASVVFLAVRVASQRSAGAAWCR